MAITWAAEWGIGKKVDYDFQQTVSVRVLYSPESPMAPLSLGTLTERVSSPAPSAEMCFAAESLLRKEP